MIFLKSLLYTTIIVIVAIVILATVYVSIWAILSVGVLLLFSGFHNLLKAKSHLLKNS
jgi:hypothetical protein